MATFPYKNLRLSDIQPLILPVDGSSGANTGQRINVTEYARVFLVLYKAIGTAGDDPVFTPIQADALTAGNSKAISITNVWTKLGLTLASLTGWTEVTQAAGNTYTNTDAAENAGLIVLEIDTADLDSTNGYKYVGLNIPDVGNNAQLISGFALLCSKRNEGDATNVLA